MTKYAPILFVSIAFLVAGCASPSEGARAERQMQRLMGHSSWPRIQQAAAAEVDKRERILGWPETHFSYTPMHHKEKLWGVYAISPEGDGDVHRAVLLAITDDGEVLNYQRHIEGM